MSYVEEQYCQSRDDDADLKSTSGRAWGERPDVGKRRRGSHLTGSYGHPARGS
jgi:hypothetical protein